MIIRKLDLTITDDAIEFAKDYKTYLPHTSLPKEVLDDIDKWEKNYNLGLITNNELYNLVLDIIVRFIKTLL